VGYGTSAPPPSSPRLIERFSARFPQLRDKRLLLFLGRIHEKKGCDLLLRAFAHVACNDRRLRLVFCGADDGELASALKQDAAASQQFESVSWLGHLQDDLKWGAFYSSELFVLPSHQENFGVAVAEALGCRLPVLISNKVNIWREVESYRAGIVCADTLDGITTALHAWLALSTAERGAFATRARALFDQRFTAQAAAQSLLRALARDH
jgi:glycosyltransferase involved in cell wall biosynthesis